MRKENLQNKFFLKTIITRQQMAQIQNEDHQIAFY